MNTTTASTDLEAITTDLDDLGNLFEFGEIDLNNIADVDATDFGEQLQHQHNGTHPSTPFQEMLDGQAMLGSTSNEMNGHDPFGAVSQSMDNPHARHYMAQGSANHAAVSNPYSAGGMFHTSNFQQSYHNDSQNFAYQGFPPGHQIPPTPNSYEMHGRSGQFLHQQQQQPHHTPLDPQQRAILEQRYHVRKDDAIALTPMVSPAGTPQFNMVPEFTTPGAYFSPLTSPMLHAQNQNHHVQQAHLQQSHQHQPHPHHQGYLTNPSTAPSSNATSPVQTGMDVDMLGGNIQPLPLPDSATSDAPARRSRRKVATTPRTLASSRAAKSSPATKAQKRKSAAHPNEPDHPSTNLQPPTQFDSSEASSVSPEPLSESIMGPPPRPSPALVGLASTGPAATPKSILRPGSTRNGTHPTDRTNQTHTTSLSSTELDDLALPESASSATPNRSRSRLTRPVLSQIDTALHSPTDHVDSEAADEDGTTPRLSARKTPKFGPLSTPSATAATARPLSSSSSALPSPSLSQHQSPSLIGTPGTFLSAAEKREKERRGSKKRGPGSVGGSGLASKLVSPALVPKISPSIKPLLPEGTPLNTASQALLLASKSNYQNILEGNHLPGVSYPEYLSSGLTSKRTSHKVAEQGRRNRINDALKEMQALIPKPPPTTPTAGANGNGEGGKVDGSGSGEDSPEDTKVATAGNKTGVGSDSKDKDKDKDDSKNGGGSAGGGANGNSSKAATVELANEYIKKMQKENLAAEEAVRVLRRENEELKRRLGILSEDIGEEEAERKGKSEERERESMSLDSSRSPEGKQVEV